MWFGNSQAVGPMHVHVLLYSYFICVFANMLIIKLFQFYNYDVRVCAGNSRNYWPVNSARGVLYDVRVRLGNSRNYWPVNNSLSWTILEFQKTVNITKLHLYKVLGNNPVSYMYMRKKENKVMQIYINVLVTVGIKQWRNKLYKLRYTLNQAYFNAYSLYKLLTICLI